MHASTARACLRRLSDWVNSVSKHQADSWLFMISSGFVRVASIYGFCFEGNALFTTRIPLTSTGMLSHIEPATPYLPTVCGVALLWQLPKSDGYNFSPCRFQGSCPM